MSVKIHTAYGYTCDHCGRDYEEGDFTIFLDEPDFEAHDWIHCDDGSIFCEDCEDQIFNLTRNFASVTR